MENDRYFLRFFLLWTLLLATTTEAYNSSGGLKSESGPALKQSSFFEWILSIFLTAVPPLTTVPTTIRPAITTTPAECTSCTCGIANTVKRIVGGYETQVNQYPWMAMMMFRGHFYCGGSLISDRYVVSAAHCLKSFPRNFITVRLMAHNLSDRSTRALNRSADKVLVHPKYSTRNYDNDIGLVRLDKPLDMSDVFRPVCMAMLDKTYDGEEAVITGWGVTSEGGQLAQNLMVNVKTLDILKRSRQFLFYTSGG